MSTDTNRACMRVAFAMLAALLLVVGCESAKPVTDQGDSGADSNAIALTPLGSLQGERLAAPEVYAFRGIHYGQSTAGANRFRPPVPVAPWQGVKPATKFGDVCPQGGEVGRRTSTGELLNYSEDCLVLNVWTPALAGGDRPVMVWLHGRGFYAGAGSERLYDGARLAARGDVVVVTLNHRLNVFGYLHLGEVGGKAFAASGNAGVQDMELALRWLRQNVRAFGGDPDNITIFGESGGGVKVTTLFGVPAAKGLFRRGIVQSGARPTGVPLAKAAENARKVMSKLGVTSVAALQQIPAEELLGAVANPVRTSPDFGPVVDDDYLPRDMFVPDSSPSAVGVPMMIGDNRDEFALYERANPNYGKMTEDQLAARLRPRFGDRYDALVTAYSESRQTSDPWALYIGIMSSRFHRGTNLVASVQSRVAPVYRYSFDFKASEKFGPAHGAEIAFVFSNATSYPNAMPGAAAVEDVVSEAWLAFARDGNPNHEGMPTWPVYNNEDRPVMVFDAETRVIDDPRAAERKVWDTDQ